MAAQKREINLLPREDWEKKPIGKIVKWALTVGRYIVIVTELVVIVAFISRFKLDRDLSNLYEEIEIKQARIRSLAKFEKEFRAVQDDLKVVKILDKNKTNPAEVLTGFASLVPLNVSLNKFDFSNGRLAIEAKSLSEMGVAVLVNNIIDSPLFEDIIVEKIVQGEQSETTFSLAMQVVSDEK